IGGDGEATPEGVVPRAEGAHQAEPGEAARAVREHGVLRHGEVAHVRDEPLAASEPLGNRIVVPHAAEERAEPHLERVLPRAELAERLAPEGDAAIVERYVPRAELDRVDLAPVLLVPGEVLLQLELALQLLLLGGNLEVEREDRAHEAVAI